MVLELDSPPPWMFFQFQAPNRGSGWRRGYGIWCGARDWNSYSPHLAEPSSAQPEGRSIPVPSRCPPPTQSVGRQPLRAAELPAGGAPGPAAAGCSSLERGSADIPGSFPGWLPPTNQHRPRRAPPTLPSAQIQPIGFPSSLAVRRAVFRY